MKRPAAYYTEPIHYLRDWKPRGVIHVGANDGEEFTYYKSMGITKLVGFEPLKDAFDRFEAAHPDVMKFQLGWGNERAKVTIEVTENDKASSVLKRVDVEDWTKHPVFKDWNMGQWPIVGTEEITIIRYADWEGINDADYNFLNMDIQGMELAALKGMGRQLENFDALVIECSESPVFKGEASGQEVSDWLDARGFERVTPIKPHNDVLFLRKDKLDD
jgi:FkbM family methyltransferase